MDNTESIDFYDEYDDVDDDVFFSPFQISNEAILQFESMLNREALRDKLSIVAYYITIFECFKAKIINDVRSIFCFPDSSSTLDHPNFIISDEYEKEICNIWVGKDTCGKKDLLKASMLWLRNQKAITKDDYVSFLKFRKLRNSYVHEMASYIVEPASISLTNYENLRKLLSLYKKIELWFVKNIEAYRSWPDELIDNLQNGKMKDEDIFIPDIAIFEMMADSLDL